MSRMDEQEIADRVNSAQLATLGLLIAGLAHELNTPLGALQSNHDLLNRALDRLTRILEDEQVDASELDEVRRIVRAIGEVMRVNSLAVERGVQLVKSLRSFGRLDRAEVDFADLHEGLESTLALLQHELRGRVAVVQELGSLPPVECQPHRIHQVFMNLILNAAQAIPDQGTITLRTRAAGSTVEIEVEDTGSGIPPAHLGRIFEPGFTSKGSRVGMGMGLLICKQIVEQHGGRIAVRSEVGRGTVFTVVLPVRLAERNGSVEDEVEQP